MDSLACFTDKEFLKEIKEAIKENELNESIIYIFGKCITKYLFELTKYTAIIW